MRPSSIALVLAHTVVSGAAGIADTFRSPWWRRAPRIPAGTARTRSATFWLGGFLFLCFVYFLPRAADWDQASRYDLALALANDGTIAIDHYRWNTQDISFAYGHYYSIMAPGQGLAATPLAWITKEVATALSGDRAAHAIGRNRTWRQEYGYYLLLLYLETVVTVAAPATALVLLFFWFLGYFSGSAVNRLIVSLALGLGTLVFPYAQIMYSHVPAALLLFGGFVLIFATTTDLQRTDRISLWLGEHRSLTLCLAGAALGLAEVYEYPAMAISSAILLFGTARLGPKQATLIVLGMLPGAAIVGWYDFAAYHNPLVTGYSGHSVLWKGRLARGVGGSTWPPSLSALFGLTFSPYRGLFYMSPWLLLALPGSSLLWMQRERSLACLCLCGPPAYVSLIAMSPFWYAGSTVGPRYLIPILPFLALPAVVALDGIRSPLWRAIALLAMVISVLNVWIQTLGRGGYPPESVYNPLFAFSLPGFWHDHLPLSLGSILLAPTGVGTSKASLLLLLLFLAGWTAWCRRSRRPTAAPETG